MACFRRIRNPIVPISHKSTYGKDLSYAGNGYFLMMRYFLPVSAKFIHRKASYLLIYLGQFSLSSQQAWLLTDRFLSLIS